VDFSDFELLLVGPDKKMVGKVQLDGLPQTRQGGNALVLCTEDGMDVGQTSLANNRTKLKSLSDAAGLPENLVRTSEFWCAKQFQALRDPNWSGTLILKRTDSEGGHVVDAVKHIPPISPPGDSLYYEPSCNVAIIRNANILRGNPRYNATEWHSIVGNKCPYVPSSMHLDYILLTFGTRSTPIDKLHICAPVELLTAVEWGVLPPEATTTIGDSHEQAAVGIPTDPPRKQDIMRDQDQILLLIVIVGGTVLLVLAVTVLCCFKRMQKVHHQHLLSIPLANTHFDGQASSIMSVTSSTASLEPMGDEDFQLTMKSAELRKQIRREVTRTDRESTSDLITPWEGDFILDDPSAIFNDKFEVGKGSFGIVYRATYFGHTVALKEIAINFNSVQSPRQRAAAKTAIKEFQSELVVFCKLNHPNVVQFYGYTTTPNVYIICEFVTGGTLYDLLHSDATIKRSEKYEFALDIACGMRYLHALSPPVMHRDLKSLNLLVASDGADRGRTEADRGRTIKITDFGLARNKQSVMGQTARMTQVGTPYWTAPEVFEDAIYNEKADVYSYAVCVWEIWSRQLPWENLQPVQVAMKVVTEKARPAFPIDMKSDLVISDHVARSWDHIPTARPSFSQIVAELENVTGHQGSHGSVRTHDIAMLGAHRARTSIGTTEEQCEPAYDSNSSSFGSSPNLGSFGSTSSAAASEGLDTSTIQLLVDFVDGGPPTRMRLAGKDSNSVESIRCAM
jgi:serine/threonine protein kinase